MWEKNVQHIVPNIGLHSWNMELCATYHTQTHILHTSTHTHTISQREISKLESTCCWVELCLWECVVGMGYWFTVFCYLCEVCFRVWVGKEGYLDWLILWGSVVRGGAHCCWEAQDSTNSHHTLYPHTSHFTPSHFTLPHSHTSPIPNIVSIECPQFVGCYFVQQLQWILIRSHVAHCHSSPIIANYRNIFQTPLATVSTP